MIHISFRFPPVHVLTGRQYQDLSIFYANWNMAIKPFHIFPPFRHKSQQVLSLLYFILFLEPAHQNGNRMRFEIVKINCFFFRTQNAKTNTKYKDASAEIALLFTVPLIKGGILMCILQLNIHLKVQNLDKIFSPKGESDWSYICSFYVVNAAAKMAWR